MFKIENWLMPMIAVCFIATLLLVINVQKRINKDLVKFESSCIPLPRDEKFKDTLNQQIAKSISETCKNPNKFEMDHNREYKSCAVIFQEGNKFRYMLGTKVELKYKCKQ